MHACVYMRADMASGMADSFPFSSFLPSFLPSFSKGVEGRKEGDADGREHNASLIFLLWLFMQFAYKGLVCDAGRD